MDRSSKSSVVGPVRTVDQVLSDIPVGRFMNILLVICGLSYMSDATEVCRASVARTRHTAFLSRSVGEYFAYVILIVCCSSLSRMTSHPHPFITHTGEPLRLPLSMCRRWLFPRWHPESESDCNRPYWWAVGLYPVGISSGYLRTKIIVYSGIWLCCCIFLV